MARTGRQEWAVEVASNGATVTFPTLYWSGWQAEVDGRPAPLRAAESTGLMTLDLAAGQHRVRLVLGRTPLRLWAEALSSLGLLVCVVLGMVRSPGGAMRRAWLSALGALVFCLLLALILRALPMPAGSDRDLTWDFGQEAYLHPSPDGVAFGEVAVMSSYQIDEWSGDTLLEVLVAWESGAAPGLEAELALVHPAEVVHHVPYVVAIDRQPLASGPVRFTLGPTAAVPPGPLLLRLRVLGRDGASIPALTATGETRGDLYLRPVWLEPPLEPRRADGIQLDSAEADLLTPETLAVTLRWEVGQLLPVNYGLSLRLRDAAGVEWAALDKWPGYGYYPTSLWEADAAFEERFFMAVPYGLPPGRYTLTASLYEVNTLIPRWGPYERPVVVDTAAPYDGRSLLHRFDAGLAVAGLTVPEALAQGDPLVFETTWVAEIESSTPVQAHWELMGPADELVSSEGVELGPWPADAVVLGRFTLATSPGLAGGLYTLRLHLAGEEPWSAANVLVQERSRQFALPEMETELGVLFGDGIELAGYDLEQMDDALKLTLYWQALEAVVADYVVFVHLYEPATEAIPVQSDAMPRAGAYPTSRWAPGEVVDDRVALSLADVPPGEYRLAVGLYLVEGDRYPRLPAVDGTGKPLPDGRAVLPTFVAIP
jgi:hypothetical protein